MMTLILFWLSQTWPVLLKIQEQTFSGYNVPPDSKETQLRSSNQEASPSASQNTRSFKKAMWHMKVCPYSYWVSFAMTDEFSVRVTKTTSRIGASVTHSLPFWFWPFLNSVKWPYYQKAENLITLNHTAL